MISLLTPTLEVPEWDKDPILERLLEGLNPEQRQTVMHPFHQGVQVLAGAGTGKTRVITHRYVGALHHLQQHNGHELPPESQILAVTFTVKAAEEMKERIHALIGRLGLPQPETPMWVHNFHGYGRRLLKTHGHLLGFTEHFAVLDTNERNQHLQAVLRDWEANRLDDLEAALAWAQLPLHAHDVLALPPHAPTDFIHWVRAFPHVLNRAKSAGLSPQAFYDTALLQTQRLSSQVHHHPVTEADGSVFENNEAMSSAWSNHWRRWAPDSSLWFGSDDEQSAYIAHRTATLKKGDPTDLEPYYGKRLEWLNKQWQWMHQGQALQPLPKKVRNTVETGELASLETLATTHADEQTLIGLMAGLYAVYQYRLYQANTCDFDDLILKPLELLQNHPTLQTQIQQQFQLVIVDEFQDTNGSQLALMRETIRPDTTNLTVVGDIKQSIYGFRDAQPDNMHWIFSGRSDVTTVHLTQNYRSHAPIVALANAVADGLNLPNTHALSAALQTEQPPPPVTHVTLEDADAQKSKVGTVRDTEAQWVASEIQRLHTEEGLPYSDVAILVKDNTKAKRMAAALKTAGIPSDRQESLAEWLNTPELKNIRALLKILARLNDDVAWVRLLEQRLNHRQLRILSQALNTLRNGHEKTTGSKVNQPHWIHVLLQLGNFEVCPELSLPVREALLDLAQQIMQARSLLNRRSWTTLVWVLAQHLGLFDASPDDSFPLTEPVSIEAVGKWLHKLSVQKATRSMSLRTLCEWIDTQATTAHQELADAEAELEPLTVKILTMHAAKGLEFPVVFVSCTDSFAPRPRTTKVDLEIQYPAFLLGESPTALPGFGLYLTEHHRFWSSSGSMATLKRRLADNLWLKPRAKAETQRLFYVAITRAQQRLYLLRSPQSPEWTNPETLLPSSQHSTLLNTITVALE
ncbi:MAG: ATP-dependent helicase [Vampirovibrionales bacterium]|nr:ATP-dependent helicase [Vampirovibrionales bacterium]